jgi:ethanolamine ammonia-lyase small subunit
MSLRYCFETSNVLKTLKKAKPHDLVVIDTDGISTAAVKAACARGVWVYGYLNAGALECEWSIRNKSNHFSL